MLNLHAALSALLYNALLHGVAVHQVLSTVFHVQYLPWETAGKHVPQLLP